MFSFHPQSIIEVRPYLVSSLWFSSLWYWLTGLDDTLKLKSKARRTDSFDWICLQPPTIKYKVGIFICHIIEQKGAYTSESYLLTLHGYYIPTIVLWFICYNTLYDCTHLLTKHITYTTCLILGAMQLQLQLQATLLPVDLLRRSAHIIWIISLYLSLFFTFTFCGPTSGNACP